MAPSYSYQYSAECVDSFLDRYSRATIFVAWKLGIDSMEFRKQLIALFSSRNNRWKVVRDTLKYIDKHDLYAELRRLNVEDFIKYLTSVRTLVEDDLLDRNDFTK